MAHDPHHRFVTFTHRHAADGVAGEAERNELRDRAAAQVELHAALDDAEEMLVLGERHLGAALQPAEGAFDALLDVLTASGVFDALVKRHDDVGAQTTLDVHRRFRGQRRRLAIQVETELHALFTDLAVGQREYLEPAGIGEDGLVPTHQSVQTAMTFDQLRAVGQTQVVGIGEHHLGAGGRHLIGRGAFDRGLGTDRHEGRGLDHTVRRDETTSPGAGVLASGGEQAEFQSTTRGPGRRVVHGGGMVCNCRPGAIRAVLSHWLSLKPPMEKARR